jgi:protease-4
MKQFFKFTLASMLGFLLSMAVIFLIFAAIIGSFLSGSDDNKSDKLSKNSILHISFSGTIKDRGSDNPFENFSFSSMNSSKVLGLNDILENIKYAAKDDKIKAIFLDLNDVPAGFASTYEIRAALEKFKESKKTIVSYADYYSQKTYYLASVSNKIYLNPQGSMEWIGLRTDLAFFKNALEKLEIQPQVIRHGKFKSAVEPFLEEKMSNANRLQVRTFQNAFWKIITEAVSKSRKISEDDLNQMAQVLELKNAKDALKNKMVDNLLYRDEVLEELKKINAETSEKNPTFITLSNYSSISKSDESSISSNKIAVIYASGEIEDGKGDNSSIGSDKFAETIREARQDDKVKAIVLRVNSPGGSALASDIIWREISLAKKIKPVVVSMGDVAASGGYYISCNASKVFASPATVTGSIGVFGLMFNAKNMLENKLGINIDTVKTHPMADIGSSTRPLTEQERAILQQGVEEVYDTFITRVSQGRNINKSLVDSLGQGRVWAGTDAKKLKLIDEYGGLEIAILEAAKLAKVDKYRTVDLPKKKDAFQSILEDFGNDTETKLIKKSMGENFKYFQMFQKLTHTNGILTRMEYNLDIY